MYALLIFKDTDQHVDIEPNDKDLGFEDLEIHYISKNVKKDKVWVRMYDIQEFPTFVLMRDRWEIGRTSKINYDSGYDIKCWVRNTIGYENQ